VDGRPSRIVQRQDGQQQRQLIPLPQSAAAAAGFLVEFAIAGRFTESVSALSQQWSSQRLQIPVPVFPEFRDDPENGVTINRNRWSVYVPETWRAAIVKNADLSNVSEAALVEYEEQELLSEVEQVLSAAGRYSGAAAGGKASAADVWFQQQAVQQGQTRLQRLRGRSGAAGVQLEEAARKLSELSLENEAVQATDRFDFLAGKDQQLNSYNDQNRTQFFFDNGLAVDGKVSSGSQQQGGEAGQQSRPDEGSLRFRFVAPPLPAKPQSKAESLERRKTAGKAIKEDALAELGDLEKAAADRPGSGEASAAGVPGALGLAKGGRAQSQLRQNALGLDLKRLEEREQEQDKSRDRGALQAEQKQDAAAATPAPAEAPAAAPAQAPAFGLAPMADPAMVPQTGGQLPQVLSEEAFGRVSGDMLSGGDVDLPRAEGMLSLDFGIPEDGVALTFLRAGGNPRLALQVQAAETVQRGMSVGWAVFCGVAALLIWRGASRGQVLVLVQRVAAVLMIAGLLAALFALHPGLQSLGLIGLYGGSLTAAALLVYRGLRKV